jgi:hypothetical protein
MRNYRKPFREAEGLAARAMRCNSHACNAHPRYGAAIGIASGFALAPERGAFSEGHTMKLNAPTKLIFLISLLLVALAVISRFTPIPYVSQYQFWVAIVGYLVLVAGVTMKGM